jgi:hypothetical protein
MTVRGRQQGVRFRGFEPDRIHVERIQNRLKETLPELISTLARADAVVRCLDFRSARPLLDQFVARSSYQ